MAPQHPQAGEEASRHWGWALPRNVEYKFDAVCQHFESVYSYSAHSLERLLAFVRPLACLARLGPAGASPQGAHLLWIRVLYRYPSQIASFLFCNPLPSANRRNSNTGGSGIQTHCAPSIRIGPGLGTAILSHPCSSGTNDHQSYPQVPPHCTLESRRLAGSSYSFGKLRCLFFHYVLFRVDAAWPRLGRAFRTAPVSRGRLAVLPGAATLGEHVLKRLESCDAVLLDGTFWSSTSWPLGVNAASASKMGHLPVGGSRRVSRRQFAQLPARRKIYLHINNTNPILLDDSPQRREVDASGVVVGWDGFEFEL